MLDNAIKRKQYLNAAFIALAIAAVGLVIWKFDFAILFFIQKYIRNDVLDVIVPLYTSLGEDGIIWIALGIVLLIPKKYRKCGIMVLAALLVMLVINNIIKNSL